MALCECGCGETTAVYLKGSNGYRKGESARFRPGHQFRKNILDRIKKWTKRNEETGCLEWTGALSHGYGYVHYKGKPRGAHIVVYELTYGPVPEGLYVCHSCDNPLCCELGHLFAGTPKDNSNDCKLKDRHARGSRNAHAILVEDDVQRIRELYAGGMSQRELAEEYNVSIPTVSMLVNRKTWSHV